MSAEKAKNPMLEFEHVGMPKESDDRLGLHFDFCRARLAGIGWILVDRFSKSIVFVPDADGAWTGEKTK